MEDFVETHLSLRAVCGTAIARTAAVRVLVGLVQGVQSASIDTRKTRIWSCRVQEFCLGESIYRYVRISGLFFYLPPWPFFVKCSGLTGNIFHVRRVLFLMWMVCCEQKSFDDTCCEMTNGMIWRTRYEVCEFPRIAVSSMPVKTLRVITGKQPWWKITRYYVYCQGIFACIPPEVKKAYPRYSFFPRWNSEWPVQHLGTFFYFVVCVPSCSAVSMY